MSAEKNRYFHAHETERMLALEGVRLAAFWQRILGYTVDLVVAIVIWWPLVFCWHRYLLRESDIRNLSWDFHERSNLVVMLLYWGLSTYLWNGRTVGKWVARTRVVSLVSERMGLWQSLERALGYGAAVLEVGLGFVQIFWDKNRMCAQDRLAETIVVDVRRAAEVAPLPARG
jgi:uncharacterized RDD family membrane protein YckC